MIIMNVAGRNAGQPTTPSADHRAKRRQRRLARRRITGRAGRPHRPAGRRRTASARPPGSASMIDPKIAADAPGLARPMRADEFEHAAEGAAAQIETKTIHGLFGRLAPGSKIRNFWVRRSACRRVRIMFEWRRPDGRSGGGRGGSAARAVSLTERSRPRTRRLWRLWKTLAFELPRFGNSGRVL